MVVKFKFNYRGKMKELDVEVCDSVFSQSLGLMFGFKKRPLLFVFNSKKRRAIHSFFCKPFVAVWFSGPRVVDVKVIRKWKLSIKPVEKFDKLLEIPSVSQEFRIFTDDKRKV